MTHFMQPIFSKNILQVPDNARPALFPPIRQLQYRLHKKIITTIIKDTCNPDICLLMKKLGKRRNGLDLAGMAEDNR